MCHWDEFTFQSFHDHFLTLVLSFWLAQCSIWTISSQIMIIRISSNPFTINCFFREPRTADSRCWMPLQSNLCYYAWWETIRRSICTQSVLIQRISSKPLNCRSPNFIFWLLSGLRIMKSQESHMYDRNSFALALESSFSPSLYKETAILWKAPEFLLSRLFLKAFWTNQRCFSWQKGISVQSKSENTTNINCTFTNSVNWRLLEVSLLSIESLVPLRDTDWCCSRFFAPLMLLCGWNGATMFLGRIHRWLRRLPQV